MSRPSWRDDPKTGRGGGKRDWWQEPRREYRPEKSAKERRMEMLTGGTGTGGSSYSDRQSLLTGRGLSSSEDRQAMLTGRSDPPREKWKSQYGGRREYDPQDRKFNRQFNTEPTNNRDVRSWFPDDVGPGNRRPATRRPQPWDNDGGPHSRPSSPADDGGPHSKPSSPAYKPSSPAYKPSSPADDGGPHSRPATNQGYDDSKVRERLRALEGRSQTGGWQEDRIKALENRPQSTGGSWDEDRIKALENRKQIVNQSTVDLSGVEGRLSQLEGRGSDWQEDRIAAIEGRKPQDLSGIQGRLTDLEGRQDDTSWKDQLSEGTSARELLSKRVASLEDYYKNDPPPEDSTGNRYEDKMAALAKGWDMTDMPTKWDPEDKRLAGYSRDQTGKSWSDSLQQGYVQGVRDLNREYNNPLLVENIQGREYKAYDPQAASRLRYLNKHNIHEDTYLGSGTWDNQYGEQISGWGKGNQDRYFTSHSGLDKDSDEYKDRFSAYGRTGKDYAWYQ